MKISIEKRKTGTSLSLETGKTSDSIHEFVVIENASLQFHCDYPYIVTLDKMLNPQKIKHERHNSKSLDYAIHFKNCEFKGICRIPRFFMCVFENCQFEHEFEKMDFQTVRFENCEKSNSCDLRFKFCNINHISLREGTCAQIELCDVSAVKLFDNCSVTYRDCKLDDESNSCFSVPKRLSGEKEPKLFEE